MKRRRRSLDDKLERLIYGERIEHEPTPCPKCGHLLDRSVSMGTHPVLHKPAKDAGSIGYSLCLECGEVLAVMPDMTMRPMNLDERIEVASNAELRQAIEDGKGPLRSVWQARQSKNDPTRS